MNEAKIKRFLRVHQSVRVSGKSDDHQCFQVLVFQTSPLGLSFIATSQAHTRVFQEKVYAVPRGWPLQYTPGVAATAPQNNSAQDPSVIIPSV